MKSRELLNKFKWTNSLDGVEVVYIHRGAPNNMRRISGYDIVEIGAGFFTLKNGTRIPYHRIVEIRKDGKVVWLR
ncbi:DUF504 domain-containing protein [Methanosarcinales archaeon]|nr:MAG: DUF504 domain-containing protein [Methanosarcinales archaeon]